MEDRSQGHMGDRKGVGKEKKAQPEKLRGLVRLKNLHQRGGTARRKKKREVGKLGHGVLKPAWLPGDGRSSLIKSFKAGRRRKGGGRRISTKKRKRGPTTVQSIGSSTLRLS